jgi:hypothetical protein
MSSCLKCHKPVDYFFIKLCNPCQTRLKEENPTPVLQIKCRLCGLNHQAIGTGGKLKGRMSINPFTSVCHFCEYGLDTLPPLIANLWEWNYALNK